MGSSRLHPQAVQAGFEARYDAKPLRQRSTSGLPLIWSATYLAELADPMVDGPRFQRQTSQRQGVIEIPRGPRLIRRPLLHAATVPMFGAMQATPTMTYGRSPTAMHLSDSPRTWGALDQAMGGTPSRMIQIQQGTPSTLVLPYGTMGERFDKGNSPEWSPGMVPCNSPIDLNKGNSLRMGIHPVMRGLRHTPESHGWNAFSALVEDVPLNNLVAATSPQQPASKVPHDQPKPEQTNES
ncbi:hypothetical protein FFLO_02380 [Filobasidium floriforme]|uniref:Uncharacterized protein n=1 Tax=Filobasidium floriforme TaxID=5210 RepID=A0A8K0JPQ6_9TREE|nr:hypothetical protein FFLO_02380 [Filobasidium floriforme]